MNPTHPLGNDPVGMLVVKRVGNNLMVLCPATLKPIIVTSAIGSSRGLVCDECGTRHFTREEVRQRLDHIMGFEQRLQEAG